MRRLVKIQDFPDPVKRYRSVALITDRVNNLKTCADEYPFVQSTSCVLKRKEAVFTSNLILNNKVVPKSAVNPDFLEPLNCKGLFATHAINQTTCRTSFFKVLYECMACLNDKVYEMYTSLRCLNLQPVARFDWRWPGPVVVNFFIKSTINHSTGGNA